MTGTPNQLELAEQIRPKIAAEFDRVANAFRHTPGAHVEQTRDETEAIIAILEEKRAEVMANERAGYFIREWQDLSDQVRQLIGNDPRYLAIKAARAARKQIQDTNQPEIRQS